MIIDVDDLRNDMENEDFGAAFGGGYGGALMEGMDIATASDEEIVQMALEKGIDLSEYEVK